MSVSLRALRNLLVRGLCLTLSFSIATSSAYASPIKSKNTSSGVLAKDLPQHTPAFPGQKYEGLDHFPRPEKSDEKAWSEYLKSEIQNAEQSNIEKIAASGEDMVQLMIAYKDFYAKSRVSIDQQIESIGSDKFVKNFLDLDKVIFEDPNLGKMEFTNIDGQPVAKIVHEKSAVGFIIFDEDALDKNSKHFKTYIARQHYDSGSSRAYSKYKDENNKIKKIRGGRDVVLMSIKTNAEVSDVQVNARKRNVQAWWHATYKHPDKKDAIQGFASGLAQFFSVGAIASVVASVLPGYDHGNTPALIASFTLAYGSMFGIWNSFYQNWRSRGPKWQRDLKNMSVSFSYYFGVSIISAAGSQDLTLHDFSIEPTQVVGYIQSIMESISQISVEGIADKASSAVKNVQGMGFLGAVAATHFFHNFLANNEAKNFMYWMQRIEEIERRDLHNISIPIPKGLKRNPETNKLELDVARIKTPVSRRYWNRQFLYYLPLNWTKFLDQVWFGWTIGPAMRGEYPAWVPLLSIFGFWTLTISSVRGINWWAYKKHAYAAEKLKIRQESSYYFLDFYQNKLLNAANKVNSSIRKIFGAEKVAPNCSELLSKDPEDKAS